MSNLFDKNHNFQNNFNLDEVKKVAHLFYNARMRCLDRKVEKDSPHSYGMRARDWCIDDIIKASENKDFSFLSINNHKGQKFDFSISGHSIKFYKDTNPKIKEQKKSLDELRKIDLLFDLPIGKENSKWFYLIKTNINFETIKITFAGFEFNQCFYYHDFDYNNFQPTKNKKEVDNLDKEIEIDEIKLEKRDDEDFGS